MAERRKRKIRWSKLYSFSCVRSSLREDLKDQIGQKGFSRVVHCNDPDNAEAAAAAAAQLGYRGNYVSTTKYTALNFLPKSLLEQFRRVANVYFLVVALVSFSPLTPYSAYSIILPLGMVIGATVIKEGIEDWRRRSQDVEANNRRVSVYRDSTFHETRWKRLRVGDIVKVSKDEYFPADLLLISSANEDGICYVETMNLDGETNLKLKHALEATSHLQNEESLREFRAVIKCEDPNDDLYSFVGTLDYAGKEHSLSLQQILLRDSKLKNTDHIFGAVIFTGHDTKVMQNATEPPSKRSKVEERMDKIIYILFSALVLISVVGSLVFGIETERDIRDDGSLRRWYLRPDDTPVLYDPRRPLLASFLHFLTALMLYGYLIPISLYVSIEIVKVLQSIFINHDQDMYDEETDKPSRARTSNLNEELGQVTTILSDKTGTLTCNSMDFVKCSIAGTAYGRGMTEVEIALERRRAAHPEIEDTPFDNVDQSSDVVEAGRSIKGFNFWDERITDGRWVNEPHSDVIQKFFRVLAVCHTAIADGDKESGEITYEAESPDEAAFVIAARELGFQFFDRTQSTIQVYEFDYNRGIKVERVYELLKILEFNSSRKRMSVIVRNTENQLLLLCKGADSVMFGRLADNGKRYEAETRAHIKKYAEAGLRTLVIAYRELDEEEYKRWEKEFTNAKNSVSKDRDALVDSSAEKIERDLILLGATAVEDKLQKGVPECIEKLSQAGIKIWVLTGDKMETAINIGYACNLLKQDMPKAVINLDSPDIIAAEKEGDAEGIEKASKESIRKQFSEATYAIQQARASASPDKESIPYGLVIDGKSLEFSLMDDMRMLFFDLAASCSSVICCRSTPKQKARVTILVKEGTGKTTLAVGDGANDVGMLQQADIGVGISGLEGMQAVMASDFSIAQFRFLERLLLVHGHWCYRRISMMICYFFYKNITFGFTLFWFEGYADFSGQAMYNDWYMSLYNVFFTSFPVIALGVFDQDVSARACLKYPKLYEEGIKNVLFCWSRIIGWMANGIISSIIIFFFTTNTAIYQAFRRDGQLVDFEILGAMLYSSVVWTVNCQMALAINYFTWIQHVFIWGSIALWYLFLVLYGSLRPTLSTTAYEVFVEACVPSPLYWVVTLFLVVSTLLPYLTFRAFQTRFSPMYHDQIQQGLLENEDRDESSDELCMALRGRVQQLRQRSRAGVSHHID